MSNREKHAFNNALVVNDNNLRSLRVYLCGLLGLES